MFLFGEAAETAQRGASSRLKRWSEAFEAWLEERRRSYQPDVPKQALLTWRRLLRERRKMPYEMTQADIEAHAAWMQAKGYAPTTIYNMVGIVASFYRWCGERQIDPECEAGFNPAAGAQRPKIRRYAGARLLSREEARALLGIVQRDCSPLGKRDYAFTLARLRMGAPLRSLQRLQWGQIEAGEGGARVRWRAGEGSTALPGEVWAAILAYLRASGRLDGMRAGEYVFAPLRYPGTIEKHDHAEMWDEGRSLSTSQLLLNLKIYGRAAGIPEEKLTLQALRRTAMRLRLDEARSKGDGASRTAAGDGSSLEAMKQFLDSQEDKKCTKYRLGFLPEMPPDEGQGEETEPNPPNRMAKPFRPGEGMTHGLYAQSQPAERVLAILAENIQGVEEEIAGLRLLARGLLRLQAETQRRTEAARLGDAYTLAASRLAGMIETEEQLAKRGRADDWTNEVLAMVDNVAKENGEEPPSEAVRAQARGEKPELTLTSRQVVEEIASTRCVCRTTLGLAEQALEQGEAGEYLHLTEIYSNACNRLMRLLRAEAGDKDQLSAYLHGVIDEAIREVYEEMMGRDEGQPDARDWGTAGAGPAHLG